MTVTANDMLRFIVAMIVMMNPLGSLSIFLDLTKTFSLSIQRRIARTCSLAMIVIMLITVWSGQEILQILGITIASFRFAGGLILLLMGLSMLQSKESAVSHTAEDNPAIKDRESIAVVPLALPVIIGPGAISTLIIAGNDFPRLVDKFSMTGFCFLLVLGMGAMLFFGNNLAKLIGPSMIKVVTRIMGMIIMSLAVGMLAEGLIGLLPALR
jgi:multiple antibiotic resistance protein